MRFRTNKEVGRNFNSTIIASQIQDVDWSSIINTPTTLSGYGITDGVISSRTLTINGTTYDLTANRTWSVGTITSITASSPLTGGTITSSGSIGITQANTSTDGYLSSTDWNTFNGKFTLPSLTSGSVLFSNGTTIAQNNNNLFWDNGNQRLGIGTNAPSAIFHSVGTVNSASLIGRGAYFNNTIVATANNDVLVGVDINPTFTNGAFTGVTNYGARISGRIKLNGYTTTSSYSGTVVGYLAFDANGNVLTTAAPSGTNIYNADGTLTGNRIVTTNNNTLKFISTVNSGLYGSVIFDNTSATANRVIINHSSNTGFGLTIGNTLKFSHSVYTPSGGAANSYTLYNDSINASALLIAGNNNNIIVGGLVDSGYKFDVNGTGIFRDNLYINKNQTSTTALIITNTTNHTSSDTNITLTSDSSSGSLGLGKYSSTKTTYKILLGKDSYLYNNTIGGDIAILNDFATGKIKFAAGGSSTAQATLTSVGILLIGTTAPIASELLQVNSNIRAVGTFVGGGTNKSVVESSGYSVTGTATTRLLNLDGTWTTSGDVTAIFLNITNTGSGANSKLIDLQIGSATKFNVAKNGIVRIGSYGSGTIVSASPAYNLAVDASGNVIETALPSVPISSITSGTYTPTVSSTSNATVTNIQVAQYMRVGDVVTVSGRMTVAAGNTISSYYLIMNVPIFSSFTSATYRCAGTAIRAVVSSNNAGWITGETSDTIRIHFPVTATSTATDIHYHFTYVIPFLT